MGTACLTFWETNRLFSAAAAPFYILISSVFHVYDNAYCYVTWYVMWLFHYSHPVDRTWYLTVGAMSSESPCKCSLSFLSNLLSEFSPFFSLAIVSPFYFLGFHWDCHPRALLKYYLDLELPWSSPQWFPVFYSVVSAFHWGYKLCY